MKILLTGLHITPYSQPIHPLSGNKLTSIIPKKDAILFKSGVCDLACSNTKVTIIAYFKIFLKEYPNDWKRHWKFN